MDLANVIAIIGLVIATAGSLFGVYMNLSSKIDRTYGRMDENKEQFYQDFLMKEVHLESVRHTKEMFEQRHNNFVESVQKELKSLTAEIKELKELLNNKTKHQ